MPSRSTIYRRKQRALVMGVSESDLPDGRGRHGKQNKDASHYRWNKSRIVSIEDYIKIRVGKSHPLADPNGYAYEHLLVWVSAGRPKPKAGELLHHANECTSDNRLGNLEIKTRSRHGELHIQTRDRDSFGRLKSKGVSL